MACDDWQCGMSGAYCSSCQAENQKHRLLLVGDPHVTVEDLKDCNRLVDLIVDTVKADDVDYVVFMGDQHHTHAVVRVEVLAFWKAALARIPTNVVMLVGNHDRSNDVALKANTLVYDSSKVRVVQDAWDLGPLRFVSWCPTHKEFFDAAGNAKTLICHQTFMGAQYENGFYAPDGIPAANVPAELIISGHVHSPQKVGKVWYLGAPRWRTASDANFERRIWLTTFDARGKLISKQGVDTSKYCRARYHINENPESVAETGYDYEPGALLTVHVHGPQIFVDERLRFWKGQGIRAVPFPIKESKHVVRESDGITVALQRYIDSFKPKYGSDPAVIKKLVAERVKI